MSVATTVAEGQQSVEAWIASGLTQREFGRLPDVKASSLNRWGAVGCGFMDSVDQSTRGSGGSDHVHFSSMV